MEYLAPKSKCLLCGSEYTSRGIGRHLATCIKKHFKTTQDTLADNYYLSIHAKYAKDYFLYLLVAQNTTLDDLDSFLRKIWLECCGHMSAFFLKKWEELPMNTRIKDLVNTCNRLEYQYDFGSTTDLIVKIRDTHKGPLCKKNKIQILARNSQPIVPCDECGKFPAVQICTECQYGGGGWLCSKCSKNHECGDEMLLPVVNSPRTGVCAYSGEIEERPIPKHLLELIDAKRANAKTRK